MQSPCCRVTPQQAQLLKASAAKRGTKGFGFCRAGVEVSGSGKEDHQQVLFKAVSCCIVFRVIVCAWLMHAAYRMQSFTDLFYPQLGPGDRRAPGFGLGWHTFTVPDTCPAVCPKWKHSGFTSQWLNRSNSICYNNNHLKIAGEILGSSPAVLKGEEKGEQRVLLAQHMPLQSTAPISTPTFKFSSYSPGQPSH